MTLSRRLTNLEADMDERTEPEPAVILSDGQIMARGLPHGNQGRTAVSYGLIYATVSGQDWAILYPCEVRNSTAAL